ncbi:MAG: endonuclease/exonuclease/phosphatase family protein [Phycisphaeraceae bacterium]|nr:endonuclease/exonuclease/phosphatase family protein [Phycisphaeraceae bacterium]
MSNAERTTGRTRRGCGCLSGVCALVLLVWAMAWILSGVSWWADIAANFAAQGALVSGAVCAWWVVRRRRGLALVALLAAGMHAWILGTGREAWLPRPIDSGAPAAEGRVRLLHFNCSSRPAPADVYALFDACHADVVSITEPNVYVQFDVIYDDKLQSEFPHRMKRYFRDLPTGQRGAGFVLSKFPLTPFPVEPDAQGEHVEEIIAAIVEAPARFGLIAVHPRSPRTRARWADGHEVARAAAGVARRMREQGLPVVLLADLNSTPSGWRSRELYFAAGLRRAKPVFEVRGTYPTHLDVGPRHMATRWPMTIAIDDAFIAGPVTLHGWGLLDPIGSDHWPVLVDVAPGP